jgi:hypothetical protein
MSPENMSLNDALGIINGYLIDPMFNRPDSAPMLSDAHIRALEDAKAENLERARKVFTMTCWRFLVGCYKDTGKIALATKEPKYGLRRQRSLGRAINVALHKVVPAVEELIVRNEEEGQFDLLFYGNPHIGDFRVLHKPGSPPISEFFGYRVKDIVERFSDLVQAGKIDLERDKTFISLPYMMEGQDPYGNSGLTFLHGVGPYEGCYVMFPGKADDKDDPYGARYMIVLDPKLAESLRQMQGRNPESANVNRGHQRIN